MRLGPYAIDVLEVELELLEDMLGSSPSDPQTYWEQIAKRAPLDKQGREEVATLPEDDEAAPKATVFHRDSHGVFVFNYHIKGFLKEHANRHKETFGVPLMRDKLEAYVYVEPRRVYVCDSDGQPLLAPEGMLTRPLRALTRQGPRTTLVASERVPAGCRLQFEVRVYANGQKRGDEIRPDTLYWLLRLGESCGLGQWRSGGWGRFAVRRCVLREADVRWKGAKFEPWQDLRQLEVQASEPPKRSKASAAVALSADGAGRREEDGPVGNGAGDSVLVEVRE